MRLRFTVPAARDLERILSYIGRHSPSGEERVSRQIQSKLILIREQPRAGQKTSRPGTRRVAVTPYPYAIFYRIDDDGLLVTAVRHTARRPL